MSEAPVTRRAITKAQSTASGHTQMTSRQPYITETPASKRVCFYKSGDAQFSGLPVVINSRTFKTFEALLDSLSKRVPLPFGVRTITTPRGHTSVRSLDQLHHGQSYICSDRRTVKPIDLERARRKLPPWYHARPVSARYFAWYAHNPAKHERRMARRSEHGVLLHSPKWLVLFRNGEADVKHRLKLQRRTTYSFEALLDRISEVMHFPVLKLYTPEGKRVDGLPALILCSGMLVAAGREPFKRRTYEVQKSSPSKWLQAKRLGRRHPITRKKKFRSNRSCPFSPSSENYFVNQIKSSMPGSLGDFPNNPNGSVEVEPVQHRESVTETELIRSLYCEQEDMPIPSDDDIEKSFRVNQDGTMTVEMKVRLTIKEAETIHWTTTVSRSNVINQSDPAIGYCSDQDANLLSQYDRVAEEVSRSKIHEQTEMDVSAAGTELEQHASARAQFLTQGSIECLETATDTEQISSYFYKEELENEEVNQEEYTTQHTLHPVPKPRCIMATEMNTASRVQSSNYRSSETFLIHDNQTNRHEKVLNIYESQTCQVLQNVPLGLPEKGSLSNGSPRGYLKSPDNIFPASLRKANGSAMEKPTTASACRGDALNPAATKRKPVRVIVKKNYLFKSANPDKRLRDYKADILKEIKKIRADILNQKGTVKPRKHFRSKAVQKLLKRRNNSSNENASLESATDQLESIQHPKNVPSSLVDESNENGIHVQAGGYTRPKKHLPSKDSTKKKTEYVELWLQKIDPQTVSPLQSSLETIPKNNTRAKASFFSQKSTKITKPSTKVDAKSLDKAKPNSDTVIHGGNQQTFKPSRSNACDSVNISPLKHSKPSVEPGDDLALKCYTVKMAVRPDMKPVLDQLCLSIQLLCKIFQHKQMPEFFSHLTKTFGSSSRILFAFLSIMSLKDGLNQLNACYKGESNLDDSGAMLKLQSLKEMAKREDTENVRQSICDLHNSMSTQLLQSWKGFQTLSNKAIFAPSDTDGVDSRNITASGEEDAFQSLIENLGVPERVREELATLNYVIESMAVTPHEDSLAEGKTKVYSTEQCSSENALEDYVNIYVHSVIDKAVDAHLRHSDNSQSFKAGSLAVPETDEDQVMNANPSNVKKKNTYTIMRTFHGDAPASDSDICEDMPSSESSFGVEMLALRGKKDQELINVKLKKQEVSIDMKHPKKDSGVRVGRKGGINEESEEWEEENSKSNKNKNEGIKSSDSLACRGHQNASVKEKVKEPVQNTSYFNEYCPQERQTGTSLTGLNSKVQLCSKNNSSGNQQKQCLSIQTEDKSQSQTQTIEKDTPPPERQPPDHVHVDLNAETCEKRHSMTCKAFSLESGTYSEEEQVILEAPECYTIYQEKFVEISEEAIECEENKLNFENDRASTIEKLTCSQQDKSKAIDPKNTEKTRVENLNVTNLEASKISVPRASTSMDSLSSSLAFSYDSKNSAPGRDSEEFSQSNRVKTIRDMFLVKSNADIPRSQTQLSSPNLSDYQPDSSEGKELSKSSEILREEKGPCRLSVARGYVKRTIEQLYGKTTKGSSLSEKRSISAESTKKREGLRATSTVSRSPIHDDHTSSTPDLSYFNPTSSVDGFHEQTQCVTLNARVGPKDAVLIDKGRWLLRENQVSPKCTSKNDDACEQVKETSTKSEHGSGNEDVPYSLFGHSPMKFEKKSSASEQTEIKECLAKTITYFHLPNDSEIQTEEQKAEAAERKDEFEVKPSAEPQQSSTTVFTSMHGKKYANKVHPIVETASPVVAQPTKKQSTEVARLSTEPDAIEMLYLFCGQHCPIL